MEPLLNITKVDEGDRLDVVLARTYPEYSRTFFQKLVREGGVTREDRPSAGASGRPQNTSPNYRVQVGERFSIVDFKSPTFHLEQQARTPRAASAVTRVPVVLYEDASLLVIDKPAGLVVHPAPGYRSGTLIDWLRGHLGAAVKVFTDPERLGLVHRLDKDTSGVLLIAKTIVAQTAISRQFHDRTVKKTYIAFVEGVPSASHGVITAPVGRSHKVPTRMAVSTNGKASETTFEVKQALGDVAQVEVHPKTGRTHQIRVHLAAIGHPIVGDRTYGSKSVWLQTYGISRPLLHAERLEIRHPESKKIVTFHAPWPKDFLKAEKLFQKAAKGLAAMAMLGFLLIGTSRADDTASNPAAAAPASSTAKTSTRPNPSHLNSRINQLSSAIKDLQKQNKDLQSAFKELQSQTTHLREQTAALQASLDGLAASSRLRDLEHAVSELNAKAVGGSTSGEEVKTQLLDLNRKIKDQQDAIEQMRDQMDRVQRQVIEQKAKADEAPPAPPVPTSSGK